MWWQDLEFLLVFLVFLHLLIFKKVWFILMGFSCGDTCLSWIEFVFDLSMWAYILVYIFEFIMEAMMMMLYNLMLWYDTLYDDDACDNDVHSMKLMHSYHTPIQYDVHAYHSVMMLSYALWCIIHVDDAYMVHTKMIMMHTLWWWCIPMMMMHDNACLMLSESITWLVIQ